MIEHLKELCSLYGPSGFEDEVREYIKDFAKSYADDIIQDTMGNLMVFRKGKRASTQKIMLCAHMDEVGFIIKGITDDGMIKFGFVGGIDPRVVIGRHVRFGKVSGVVGIKAVHLTSASERKTMPKSSDLYIDIGATSKSQAEGLVELGDYGIFESRCVEFGDGLFKAKAIDDRFGCAVLMDILKDQPPVDTWFVFTVQEEVGLRGAQPATYRINPDICIVVEGTTAADLADVEKHNRVCSLRNGAVIPFMDRGTIYSQEIFEKLRTIAQENNIKWQTKQMVAGGTDAGRIHLSRGGVKVCTVAAPVRYIHSPSCVAATEDMQGVLNLVKLFLEEVK